MTGFRYSQSCRIALYNHPLLLFLPLLLLECWGYGWDYFHPKPYYSHLQPLQDKMFLLICLLMLYLALKTNGHKRLFGCWIWMKVLQWISLWVWGFEPHSILGWAAWSMYISYTHRDQWEGTILQGADIYKRHIWNFTPKMGHDTLRSHFIFIWNIKDGSLSSSLKGQRISHFPKGYRALWRNSPCNFITLLLWSLPPKSC